MPTSLFSLLIVKAALSFPVGEPAGDGPVNAHDRAVAVAEVPQVPTDEAIVNDIERVGKEWLTAKKGVAGKVLVSQLGRERCALQGSVGASRSSVDLYEDLRKSVLVVASLIDCGNCERLHASCSGGFLISDSGEIVTNYHVVDQPDAALMMVRTWDGRHFPIAEVLAANRSDDVAVLRLETTEADVFDAAPLGAPAIVGSDAWVLSHPDHHFYMLTKGIVSRYHRQLFEGVLSSQMDITADFAMGSSGCPVLSTSGDVIGVVSTTETIFYMGGPDPSEAEFDKGSGDGYGGYETSPQMIIKSCVPVADIRKLLRDS